MRQEENPSIHIFLGDDTKRSRESLRRAVEDAKAKDITALVSRFDDTTFDPGLIREALQNQSIFGGGNIVVLDGLLDHEGGAEFYQSMAKWRENVGTVFIRETNPSKEIRALCKEMGKVEEFLERKVVEKKNNFALADAVAMRDKRSAWAHFVDGERSGTAMEEMHGMIFWAVKALYLCATQTKEEAIRAGVKEFTYRTYQPRTKNFLVRELAEKLTELKDMYHKAHEGDADLGIFLEQFLLKL